MVIPQHIAQYFWISAASASNVSRGSSAHDMLVISGMKTDVSEAGIQGKKEKGSCDRVKFSGVKNGDKCIFV